jgi:sortase A
MAKKKEKVDDRKKGKQFAMLGAKIIGGFLIIWVFYQIIRTALIGRRTTCFPFT